MADISASYAPVDPDNRVIPAPYSGDDDPELFDQLTEWFRQDRDHSHEWRNTDCRESYDMVASRQWDPADIALLEDQLRPVVTFNRMEPMVRIVSGLEVGNRQEVRYIPRRPGQGMVDEMLTGAAKWIRDECDAEDEESDAFLDAVITGMGWVETTLCYDVDPDGRLEIDRVDPTEMYWDCGSTKRNCEDARRLFRVKDVPVDEAQEMFPDADIADLHAAWADDVSSEAQQPHDATEAPFYRTDQSGRYDRTRREVRLVQVQWWEYKTTWRILDPFTRQETTLDDGSYNLLSERLAALKSPPLIGIKQRTRDYQRAFLGARVLKRWAGPAKGGFTWKCITGYRDRNEGTWYGIVRAMKDPQRWANKWMSQTLHILNTGAKGGIMAELDAFDDKRKAQEDWADPAAIVYVNPGAISGGKIEPRPQNPMPQGLPDLLTLAISSIRDCTGINLELLGLVEKDQPGVLEHMRKQAGMTVLASLFDSLRRYRKSQGRLMLWYIVSYLSDGRLIKIGGPSTAQYIPLLRQPDTVEYDVIVDDTPTSPNMKEQVWQVLVQMMPYLTKLSVPPSIYLELLKYSPLPETITEKINQLAQQQQPQPDPKAIAAQASAQLDIAQAEKVKAETANIGAQQRSDMAKLQAALAKAQADTASSVAEMHRTTAEARTNDMQNMIDLEKGRAQIEALRAQAVANLAKAGIAQQSADTDAYLAALEALDKLTAIHHERIRLAQGQQQMAQDAEAGQRDHDIAKQQLRQRNAQPRHAA